MQRKTNSPAGTSDLERCALLSALRRRGLAPREGTESGSVTVEFGYRMVTVRLTDDGWTRAVSGQPGSSAIVARRGHEEDLARQLARELLDRLP
ncbi:hypothetical protein [Nocardiopsis valliformis]|uniref:hypothetical protein n=1 Tax=Nocardiopsis valliformis TaxID=239974 RepID=UPI0012697006|nr:hypothetical protein [Nocardiopsis valliformis]